ncbi:hypothetical protein BDR03DRAFT_328095 [Suillus americanus]|nr:hypothetical protein BDR03DRAFT_328095 [Suillus americanus]
MRLKRSIPSHDHTNTWYTVKKANMSSNLNSVCRGLLFGCVSGVTSYHVSCASIASEFATYMDLILQKRVREAATSVCLQKSTARSQVSLSFAEIMQTIQLRVVSKTRTGGCVKESKFISKGTLEADYMDEYWDIRFLMARHFLRSASIQVFLRQVLLMDVVFREDVRASIASSGLYDWLLKVISVIGGEKGDGVPDEETKKDRGKHTLAIDALTCMLTSTKLLRVYSRMIATCSTLALRTSSSTPVCQSSARSSREWRQ